MHKQYKHLNLEDWVPIQTQLQRELKPATINFFLVNRQKNLQK
jgi:hypothetical protein